MDDKSVSVWRLNNRWWLFLILFSLIQVGLYILVLFCDFLSLVCTTIFSINIVPFLLIDPLLDRLLSSLGMSYFLGISYLFNIFLFISNFIFNYIVAVIIFARKNKRLSSRSIVFIICLFILAYIALFVVPRAISYKRFQSQILPPVSGSFINQ